MVSELRERSGVQDSIYISPNLAEPEQKEIHFTCVPVRPGYYMKTAYLPMRARMQTGGFQTFLYYDKENLNCKVA